MYRRHRKIVKVESTGFRSELLNSVLHCYSNITSIEKMPKEYFTLKDLMTPKVSKPFFNFISVIRFDKKLINEINSTMKNLKEFVTFVCSNHESFALNCGKGYLPYHRSDITTMVTSQPPKNQNEQELIKSISKKNLNTMYIPKSMEDVIRFKYTRPEVAKSLSNNTVTNILISDKP
jgi:hypothetical protein